jgi:hypothetical protein
MRAFLVAFLLLLPVTASADEAPRPCPPGRSWEGVWDIWGADGVSFGKMTVHRKGDAVWGAYTGAVHDRFIILGGWFEGKVLADGSVKGRWFDDGPEISKHYLGDFRWSAAKDGNAFSGRWKTDEETRLRREWYGKRLKSRACPRRTDKIS